MMLSRQYLTNAFTSLLKKFNKGRLTHIKEIQTFEKYFKTIYDPNDLRWTVIEVTMTLKDKLMAKLADLSIPTYVKDRYSFAPRA